MSRLTYCPTILAIAIAMFLTNRVSAQGCQHCGCQAPCQKVCRLVCEEKKVEITCWGCKVEDFCIPGPSKPGCKHCDVACEFCDEDFDAKSPIASPKKFVWTEWIPGCATIHTRKKLMKRTVTKTIPSYKWVVEDLCEKCESSVQQVKIDGDAEFPPLPNFDAAVKFLPASIAPME